MHNEKNTTNRNLELMHESELIELWYFGKENEALAAINFLAKKYHKIILAFAFGLCKNKEVAEDMTQETFEKVLEYQKKGEKIKEFYPFMIVAVRMNYYCYCRKIKNRANILKKHYTLNNCTFPNVEFEDKEYEDMLLNVLLTNKQQRVYRKHKEGFSYEEIAAASQETEDQARGKLHRANKKLRQYKELILSSIHGFFP